MMYLALLVGLERNRIVTQIHLLYDFVVSFISALNAYLNCHVRVLLEILF